MTFKEFLVYESDYETFSSLNEGEFLDTLLAGPKFAAGMAGNILGQNLRGVGNVGYGAAQSLYGSTQSGVGALQYLGGGGKRAAKKFRSGLSSTAQGLGRAARGATQILASPFTSFVRGAQAIDDKKLGGVLAPNDAGRSYAQDLFGLSSASPVPRHSPEAQTEPATERKPDKTPEPSVRSSNSKRVSKKRPESKPSQHAPQEYYDLVDKLRRASSKKEGITLTAEIARKFPDLYAAARSRATQLSRGRPSTDPSGRFRSSRLKHKSQTV